MHRNDFLLLMALGITTGIILVALLGDIVNGAYDFYSLLMVAWLAWSVKVSHDAYEVFVDDADV